MFVHGGDFCTASYMWKLEGNFWELLLSSHHMGFWILTQIISFTSKSLYPVGHLPSLQWLSHSAWYTAITPVALEHCYWPKGESCCCWSLPLIFTWALKMATSCFLFLQAGGGGAYSRHFRHRTRYCGAFRNALCYQLDRIQDDLGLWARLWEVIFILFIDMGRPISTTEGTISWAGDPGLYETGKTNRALASMNSLLSISWVFVGCGPSPSDS